MTLKIRSSIALVLLACFPLVALALAGGILVGGIAVAEAVGALGTKIFIVGLIVLVALVGSFVGALRHRPEPVEGPELTREIAPGLWQLVDNLATRMDVGGPRRIVLVPDVNAGVTEVGGQREMMVGLPLLVGLTRAELVAVLGHELGHYAHGHTALVARTYRWSLLAEGVIERTSNGLARGFLALYYRLYLLFASSANRQQELQADDWAARLTDPLTAAAAMERITQLDVCWSRLVEDYLPLTVPARRRAPLATGLHHLIQSYPVPADALARAAEPTSAFDSHPPIAERVARFRQLAAASGQAAVQPDPVPAWALLADAGTTLDLLESALLEDDDPRAEWDEVVRLAGQAEAERMVGVAARALEGAGRGSGPGGPVSGPVTVGELLAAFAHGRAPDVVLPLVRGGLDRDELAEAVPAVTADLLAALVHLALAADGRARYALSWTGPRRWQLWYGDQQGWQDVDLDVLVAVAAKDPAQVADLYRTLQSWNARLDLPIEAQALAADDAPPLAFWGHLLLTAPLVPTAAKARRPRGRKRIVDVVVYPGGLLLVRPRRVLAFGLNAVHAYGKKAVSRCEQLLEQAGTRPAEYAAAAGTGRDGAPLARWIPEADLVGVQHVERAMRGDLYRITLRSGEIVTLQHHDATVDAEEPLEKLTMICNYR